MAENQVPGEKKAHHPGLSETTEVLLFAHAPSIVLRHVNLPNVRSSSASFWTIPQMAPGLVTFFLAQGYRAT